MTKQLLTIEQVLSLWAALNGERPVSDTTTPAAPSWAHDNIPVIVCTDKRGVVFGYTSNKSARPVTLTNARMCLRWSAKVGGVFGLGDKGPFDASKEGQTTVSAILPSLDLEGVTAVFSVTPEAEKAWVSAVVAGR